MYGYSVFAFPPAVIGLVLMLRFRVLLVQFGLATLVIVSLKPRIAMSYF